jgi:hypothetical protein
VSLCDLAFDPPEVHVVRTAKEMYYGTFSDFWPRNKRIELRGVDKDTMYESYGNRKSFGEVKALCRICRPTSRTAVRTYRNNAVYRQMSRLSLRRCRSTSNGRTTVPERRCNRRHQKRPLEAEDAG